MLPGCDTCMECVQCNHRECKLFGPYLLYISRQHASAQSRKFMLGTNLNGGEALSHDRCGIWKVCAFTATCMCNVVSFCKSMQHVVSNICLQVQMRRGQSINALLQRGVSFGQDRTPCSLTLVVLLRVLGLWVKFRDLGLYRF